MDFIKKYRKYILAALAVLATLATLTVTGVDDRLISVATDFVNSLPTETVSPTIVLE